MVAISRESADALWRHLQAEYVFGVDGETLKAVRELRAALKVEPGPRPETQASPEPPRWGLLNGARVHIAREWDLRQMDSPFTVVMRCGARPDSRWSRTMANSTCHRCLSWETKR